MWRNLQGPVNITEYLNKSDPALDSEINLKDLYLLLKNFGIK